MPHHQSTFLKSSGKWAEKKIQSLVSLLTECYARFSQHSEAIQLALLFSLHVMAHLIQAFSVVGLECGLIR